MRPRSVFSFVALAAALAAAPAQAQVNRCVDDQGKVTFSDTLCSGSSRAQKEFGANGNARGWQTEEARPQRVAQGGGAGSAPAGRTAPGTTATR